MITFLVLTSGYPIQYHQLVCIISDHVRGDKSHFLPRKYGLDGYSGSILWDWDSQA
jgi:hypothetical protein